MNNRIALVLSGYENSSGSQDDQRALLLLLLGLALLASASFSIINYLYLHYWLAYT